MGNTASLRIAIEQERWRDVSKILEDDGARERARNKPYRVSQAGTAGQTATALHLACHHNPPEDIVRTLLAINPESVMAPSEPTCEVPLHFAVRARRKSGTADEAIRVLLGVCPQSVTCRSAPQHGSLTPLHLACAVKAPPGVIMMLRNADPVAAQTVQDGRGRTAWEIAKRHRGILSIVWRRKVRSILRTQSSIQSSIQGEDATGDGEMRLGELPSQVPNAPPAPAGSPPALPTAAPASQLQTNLSNRLSNRLSALSIFSRSPGSAAAQPSAHPSAPPLPTVEEKGAIGEGEDMCVVCWDGRADHAIVPCGHLCLCANCSAWGRLQGTLQGRCPVCKCRADRAMRVFPAGVPNPEPNPDPPTVPALPVAHATLVGTIKSS